MRNAQNSIIGRSVPTPDNWGWIVGFSGPFAAESFQDARLAHDNNFWAPTKKHAEKLMMRFFLMATPNVTEPADGDKIYKVSTMGAIKTEFYSFGYHRKALLQGRIFTDMAEAVEYAAKYVRAWQPNKK